MRQRLKNLAARLARGNPAGPIFVKELRVASRRGRTYLLRAAYLALMAIFTAIAWTVVFKDSRAEGINVYEMSDLGKNLVAGVVWFQFLAVQIVAIVSGASAITEEVERRTLPALMTSPVTPFQILTGKLLAKMHHVLGLILIGLPLLAVVRVMGGVPWEFIIATSAITFAMGIATSAVTIFFSCIFRRTYVTMLVAMATVFAGSLLLAQVFSIGIAFASVFPGSPAGIAMACIAALNPPLAMFLCTAELYSPAGQQLSLMWILTCLGQFGLALLVLAMARPILKKQSLPRALGDPQTVLAPIRLAPLPISAPLEPSAIPLPVVPSNPPAVPANTPPPPPPPILPPPAPIFVSIQTKPQPLRELPDGSPVLWRELSRPLLSDRTAMTLTIAVPLGIMLLYYAVQYASTAVGSPTTSLAFTFVLTLLPMLAITLLGAMIVSSEKETGALPILLTTPLTDRHILGVKVLGVLRRTAFLWVFLAVHLAVNTLMGSLHPIFVLHMLMIVSSATFFLCALSAYFSCRLRRTATALLATLGVTAALWIVLPLLAPQDGGLGQVAHDLNPLHQISLTAQAAGPGNLLYPLRPQVATGPLAATGYLAVSMLLYLTAATALFFDAIRRLRKDLYS